MTNHDDQLLSIFWEEVGDYLGSLNEALLNVEMIEGDERRELLKEMNRLAHSMKGAARAVGLGFIETTAHYMEEVFQLVQRDALDLTPDVADSLYDGLDLIQNVMDEVANDDEVVADVLSRLEQFVAAANQTGAAAAPIPPEASTNLKDDSKEIPALRLSERTPAPDEPAAPAPPEADEAPPQRHTRPMPAAPALSTMELGGESPTMMMRPAEESIRVTVRKLDDLMAEASELVVAKMQGENRQRQLSALRQDLVRWQREWRGVRAAYVRLVRRMQSMSADDAADLADLFKFLETNQRYLNETNRKLSHLQQMNAQDNMHLTTLADQLQDDVSDLRMMPFESVIGGFQRVARDLARDMHKQVHLDILGGAVEIDKTVLDALKDPLMHLVRNALDHGIETPDERESLGKPPTGRLHIGVEQRGSEIVIRINDDGRGLDVSRIKRKALERQIMTTQEINALNEDELRGLIFHAGFSTSEHVTALSGRGLGMEIVRDRVEGLRGRVSVQSELGVGTTVTLSVPVSLTRLRCILLRVGAEQYALPSAMVARMEQLPRQASFTAEGQEMISVNGRALPLVALASLLEVPPAPDHDGPGQREHLQMVSLVAADRTIAFEVDELSSELELVLKPLGPELLNAPFVAGAALLGSGQVMIVLDANELVRHASGSRLPRRVRSLTRTPATASRRALRVLVVDDSITTRTLEKNILETAGYEVHVAMDGNEAWSMLSDLNVDVVISDVEMPKMNGLELVKRIKSAPHTANLPVILLTSLAKPQQREEGLKAGADAYLIKSRFDQGELLNTINAVL